MWAEPIVNLQNIYKFKLFYFEKVFWKYYFFCILKIIYYSILFCYFENTLFEVFYFVFSKCFLKVFCTSLTEGWQGWLDLGDWLHIKMVHPQISLSTTDSEPTAQLLGDKVLQTGDDIPMETTWTMHTDSSFGVKSPRPSRRIRLLNDLSSGCHVSSDPTVWPELILTAAQHTSIHCSVKQ